MWKLQNVDSTQGERPEESGCIGIATTNQLDHVNQLVLSQITTFLAEDAQTPFKYNEVNFDDLINQIDPQLWNAICLLTRSTSELSGTYKVTNSATHRHLHTILRGYITFSCLVQYCFVHVITALCHCTH